MQYSFSCYNVIDAHFQFKIHAHVIVWRHQKNRIRLVFVSSLQSWVEAQLRRQKKRAKLFWLMPWFVKSKQYYSIITCSRCKAWNEKCKNPHTHTQTPTHTQNTHKLSTKFKYHTNIECSNKQTTIETLFYKNRIDKAHQRAQSSNHRIYRNHQIY